MVKEIKINSKVIGKKYGVVVPLGAGGESDYRHLYSPNVIYDGSTYKMWYGGYDGYHARIHYATSTDGITWDKQGIVVPLGADGESDDYYIIAPSVIYDGNIYKMWYGGHDGSTYRIHYATSTDGIHWDKHGVVIPLGVKGDSDYYLTHTPNVIYDGTTYKMWYNGYDGSTYRILYATSEDGIDWTKYGIVIDIGLDGECDDVHTHAPYVIYDGSTYKMWYSGYDGTNYKIHYATSTDGKVWTKYGVVVVVGIERDGASDEYCIDSPSVIYDGTIYKIWYVYDAGDLHRIHYTELSELSLK